MFLGEYLIAGIPNIWLGIPASHKNKLEPRLAGYFPLFTKANTPDSSTSGLEGAWTATPTHFSMQYLSNLFKFEWVKTNSPAGATQWTPKDGAGEGTVPDAHDPTQRHAPIMFTTDLALRFDPAYEKISKRFLDNSQE